jgi:hypothetical protein
LFLLTQLRQTISYDPPSGLADNITDVKDAHSLTYRLLILSHSPSARDLRKTRFTHQGDFDFARIR